VSGGVRGREKNRESRQEPRGTILEMIRQGTHSPRSLIGASRELRKRDTDAEFALWSMLRNRQLLGLKFRRQHQIGSFIVDFCCLELKLVVELDGARHFEETFQIYDASRTEKLQAMGMTVVRFENEQVLLNMKIVRGQMLRVIRELRELRS